MQPSKRLGIRFRIGAAFTADDPLARWMTVCAMALNDLLLVNRWLVPRLEEKLDSAAYENVYLARLGGAHLFEVAKFLERSDRRVPVVSDFIDTLEPPVQEAYETVKSVGPRGTGAFAVQLKRARDQFFHYAELLPGAEDHEALKRAMEAHAATTGDIRDEGTAIDHFRAAFADEVAVELTFPGDDVDLKEFLAELSETIAAFLKFAFSALAGHVRSLPREAWEYIDED